MEPVKAWEYWDQIPKFCFCQVVFALEQLNKITCQETATPHEQWFQMTYSDAIQGALEALQSPPDPSDHRSSWEPFKQVITSSVVYFSDNF